MTTRIRTTRIYYEGDGSTVDFAIPFDYLAKRFVQVYVDNELQQGGTSDDRTAVYYFANPTTIRFNTAPASGTQVLIKRFTDATDRIVTFNDASVLLADDLNASQIQTIHIAEEGRDIIDDALIVNTDGNWDARNRRIVNVADPIDPQDALTYGIYLNDAEGAIVARDEAVLARDEAVAAASEAKESRDAAASFAVTASDAASLTEQYAQEVADDYDVVVELAAQINQKADETLKAFEESQQTITGIVNDSKQELSDIVNQANIDIQAATETVLETKDYIEELVNNNVVQSGLACARSTWVLEEDLPANTVISIPHGVTFIVGRKHLFMSYDGMVMSPTYYNEVGTFNTESNEVSFNFDLFRGQELSAWVVTLGYGDTQFHGRVGSLEANMTQAQADIESLKAVDEATNQTISELLQVDRDVNAKLEALQTQDGTFIIDVLALKEADKAFTADIEDLRQADVDINTRIDNLATSGDASNTAINELKAADEAINQSLTALTEADTSINARIDALVATDSGSNVQIEVINTTLAQLAETDESIKESIDTLNTTTESLSTSISNLQQADVDINDTLKAFDEFGRGLVQDITTLQQTDTNLSVDITNLQQTDTQLSESIQNINTNINDLNVSISGTNSNLQASVEALNATDVTLQASIDDLWSHINDSGEITLGNNYKTVTVDGTEISATTSEDTLHITAGDNIKLTADASGKSFSISATVPEVPSVPVEMVIVNSLEEVPADLKVGGIALVKEGYDE